MYQGLSLTEHAFTLISTGEHRSRMDPENHLTVEMFDKKGSVVPDDEGRQRHHITPKTKAPGKKEKKKKATDSSEPSGSSERTWSQKPEILSTELLS